MRKALFWLLLIALLSGCSKSLSELQGELTYYGLSSFERCENSRGQTGEVSTGEGVILGTIEVLGLIERTVTESGIPKCRVSIRATEIDLDTNVLIIEFNDSLIEGRWILKPSQFKDGLIQLTL